MTDQSVRWRVRGRSFQLPWRLLQQHPDWDEDSGGQRWRVYLSSQQNIYLSVVRANSSYLWHFFQRRHKVNVTHYGQCVKHVNGLLKYRKHLLRTYFVGFNKLHSVWYSRREHEAAQLPVSSGPEWRCPLETHLWLRREKVEWHHTLLQNDWNSVSTSEIKQLTHSKYFVVQNRPATVNRLIVDY